ncbi:glycosidase [Phototrophicus methaneseepsis]|uniref:Glycosidase n=1 Tax=Phototrophicus methaneseepsis TaxID=2710758 RepID=A0A7S8IEA4_9CHLR|nr:glycosidase [Phototrophicus methaneseepsis]QPC82362.1 glycosidase [Phototrophicus methaneseepsis]
MRLVRHPQSPLMYPNPLHRWEAMNVFNSAVVQHNGLFHMLYRAQGVDFISHIGYAVSKDGLKWNRLEEPVISPHLGRDDYRGVEDPRVTPLDGKFYMTYTLYGENSFYPMIAQSNNLIDWEDIGPLEKAENKDHVLFPEKMGGRYVILHRRPKHIWIGYSDDLLNWTDHEVIMSPRPDNGWDATSIGSNGVPIKTEYGWLLFYHGYNEEHVYRQSVALLDLEDPRKVLHRPKDIIMEPEETWEIKGDVPNVIFSCSANVVGDDLYFYYAGADRLIGLATAPLKDVIDFARFG